MYGLYIMMKSYNANLINTFVLHLVLTCLMVAFNSSRMQRSDWCLLIWWRQHIPSNLFLLKLSINSSLHLPSLLEYLNAVVCDCMYLNSFPPWTFSFRKSFEDFCSNHVVFSILSRCYINAHPELMPQTSMNRISLL